MLQTSSQGRNPFVYPKCPSLAFSGSLSSNWATYFVGYIKIIPSFPAVSLCASTECSLSQLSIDQSFISFPSLSTKPKRGGGGGGGGVVVGGGGGGVSRLVVAVLSFCES